jgi:hypothetical protein
VLALFGDKIRGGRIEMSGSIPSEVDHPDGDVTPDMNAEVVSDVFEKGDASAHVHLDLKIHQMVMDVGQQLFTGGTPDWQLVRFHLGLQQVGNLPALEKRPHHPFSHHLAVV